MLVLDVDQGSGEPGFSTGYRSINCDDGNHHQYDSPGLTSNKLFSLWVCFFIKDIQSFAWFSDELKREEGQTVLGGKGFQEIRSYLTLNHVLHNCRLGKSEGSSKESRRGPQTCVRVTLLSFLLKWIFLSWGATVCHLMNAALRLLLLTASVHTCTKSRSAEWVSCKSKTYFLCCCYNLCLTFISSYYSHWMMETMKQRNKERKRRRRAVCGFKMCHANEAVHPGSC